MSKGNRIKEARMEKQQKPKALFQFAVTALENGHVDVSGPINDLDIMVLMDVFTKATQALIYHKAKQKESAIIIPKSRPADMLLKGNLH